jgi:hypothetical protein
MHRKRMRALLIGTLALSVTVGLTASTAEAAKKKKKPKAGGTVDITMAGGPIPDATMTTNGKLTSTINVGGKKFRNTQIRDVNVVVQTLGLAGPDPADDLFGRLTSPNGATTSLFFGLSGISIGPLALDDETPVTLGGMPPAPDSETLVSPYQGTAQPNSLAGIFTACLCVHDGGPASGTWTLRLYDSGDIGQTSSLVSWRLVSIAGKAFKTK